MNWNSILNKKDIQSNTSLDAINQLWLAIMSMNIIDVYTLLNSKIDFGNLTKTQFVKKLDIKFDKHKQIEENEFYLNLIECHKDHKGEIICEFVGTNSGINLGIFFEIKNKQIAGLHFCECFGGVEDLDSSFD